MRRCSAFKAGSLMRNQDGRKSMFVNLTLCIMGSGRLGGHKPYHRAVINYPLYGQCDLSDERTCLTGNKLKWKGKKVGMKMNLNMPTRKSFSFNVGYQALTEISDTLNHNSAIPATEFKSCRKMQRPHALWTPQRTWEPWAPRTTWVWASQSLPLVVGTLN